MCLWRALSKSEENTTWMQFKSTFCRLDRILLIEMTKRTTTDIHSSFKSIYSIDDWLSGFALAAAIRQHRLTLE